MIVLDCESRASALASLAAIFNVEMTALDAFLRPLDLDTHCSARRLPHPNETELLHLVGAKFGNPKHIDRVCWFHLTRTHPKSDFRDGIQPLSTARAHVWETILEAFRNTRHGERLSRMRREGVSRLLKNSPR